MIIVELLGGLGNQMFQYASAFSLSKRSQTILRYDKSRFHTYLLHSFALDKLCIEAREVSNHEKISVMTSGTVMAERSLEYDDRFDKAHDNVFLEGYWQSELYFRDYRSSILDQFKPIKPMHSSEDLSIREIMQRTTAVVVHIRRGDYVHNQQTMAVHGVLSLEYYLRARDVLLSMIKITDGYPVHWFIFSDDPSWARESLGIFEPKTIVSHNGPENNFRDLDLMSTANHHIIANSSFSWWGAWLASSANQVVIAPQNWFAKELLSSKDLVPAHWIRV